LYRWGFRQVTNLGKKTETVYAHMDFCREDLRRIGLMSSVTVEKIRRQSSRLPGLGTTTQAMSQPSISFPSQIFHTCSGSNDLRTCITGSYDAQTSTMVDLNTKESGNFDSISKAGRTRILQESSLLRASPSLDASSLTAESMFYDSDTPATDSWLQLLASEYHQNQARDLASPCSAQSVGAADEITSTLQRTPDATGKGRSDRSDGFTTAAHPGALLQGENVAVGEPNVNSVDAMDFSGASN
jgi:hypothetical protein